MKQSIASTLTVENVHSSNLEKGLACVSLAHFDEWCHSNHEQTFASSRSLNGRTRVSNLSLRGARKG